MSRHEGSRIRAVAVAEGGERTRIRDALEASERIEVGAGVAPGDVGSIAETVDVVCAWGTDGYDAVRALDRNVPVVAVADDVGAGTLEEILADPAADHLSPTVLEAGVAARAERLVERVNARTAWQLADFADQAVVAFDLDTYELTEANDLFFDQWGWAERDVADATLADLRVTDITHDLRGQGRGQPGEEFLEWITDTDPVGSLVESARGGGYEVREWHCVDADGRTFKATVKVVADDVNGRGFLVAAVPAGGRTDRSLDHDEAAMLRSLVEHIPMSVYFKDARSRHVLVSDDAVDPFIESSEGKIMHTPEDVHMKTDFDLFPDDLAEEAVADNRQVIETGEPIRDRIERVQPPHGRELFFSTTKAPWYDDEGRVQGVVGVTVEITEQRYRERELDRQNDLFAEVLDVVDDRVIDPLGEARQRLDRYRESGDDADLDRLSERLDRVESVADGLVTYARLGRRVADEETDWIDPNDVVAAAWERSGGSAGALAQSWEYEVRTDRERLCDLFDCLFEAVVDGGGDAVAIETLPESAGFAVDAPGLCVPADLETAVFDREEPVDPLETGIALPIVREVAAAHGWEVAVVDRDGGTRFEFTSVPRGDPL